MISGILKKCSREIYSLTLPNDSTETKRVTGAHLKLYNQQKSRQDNYYNVNCNLENIAYHYLANDQEAYNCFSAFDYEGYSHDNDDHENFSTDDCSPESYSLPSNCGNYS